VIYCLTRQIQSRESQNEKKGNQIDWEIKHFAIISRGKWVHCDPAAFGNCASTADAVFAGLQVLSMMLTSTSLRFIDTISCYVPHGSACDNFCSRRAGIAGDPLSESSASWLHNARKTA
jgi:hypothetical protein